SIGNQFVQILVCSVNQRSAIVLKRGIQRNNIHEGDFCLVLLCERKRILGGEFCRWAEICGAEDAFNFKFMVRPHSNMRTHSEHRTRGLAEYAFGNRPEKEVPQQM